MITPWPFNTSKKASKKFALFTTIVAAANPPNKLARSSPWKIGSRKSAPNAPSLAANASNAPCTKPSNPRTTKKRPRSATPCEISNRLANMSSQATLADQIKAAMLARDADRLSTLRLLKSAVGYAQIERKTESLSDADIVVLIQKEVKKRRDAIEQFEKGGRPELARKEKQEIIVLESFLPKPLSLDELEQLVRAAIQETGATSRKQMGQVIKSVQARAAGRAEGKVISELVGKLLP